MLLLLLLLCRVRAIIPTLTLTLTFVPVVRSVRSVDLGVGVLEVRLREADAVGLRDLEAALLRQALQVFLLLFLLLLTCVKLYYLYV